MKNKTKNHGFSFRGILLGVTCFLIMAGGIIGMSQLASSTNPPDQKKAIQRSIAVEAIPVEKQSVSLTVSGYGQANPVHIAEISPEVSGNVIEKHESLDQGGLIQEGETLFKIDDTDYKIKLVKAEIQVKLRKNQIEQIKVSYERDQGRLSTVQQNTALSKAEFLRLKSLYEKDRVGTLSAVEAAEQSYNSLLDTEKSLMKAIALYPLQITEAQTNLADAEADLKTARLNVKRCVITAPFNGRIKKASVETGTYITTGTPALTLADDTVLEIQVALSDKDAFEILGLREIPTNTTSHSSLQGIECRVETVTGNVYASLPASLHRVVHYDSDVRTLYLAARVSRNDPLYPNASVPLMDGMFCKVFIKGKQTKEATKIPASALNPDNTVYLARDNKLKTLSVSKVMEDGEYTYISGSFHARDKIITTPLANPIENTRIDISNTLEHQKSLVNATETGGL